MPAPNHLDMQAINRYEDLDDAPVDPVFEYDQGEPSRDKADSRRQQTPFYSRDQTEASRRTEPSRQTNQRQDGGYGRNTENSLSRSVNRNGEPSRGYNPGKSRTSQNYNRGNPEASLRYQDATRSKEASRAYDPYQEDRYQEPESVQEYSYRDPVRYADAYGDETPPAIYADYNDPVLDKARRVYNSVRTDDLYLDENFVEHKDEPLYRERQYMIDEKIQRQPYLDNRFFNEDEDEDDMGDRMRHGDMGMHRGKLVTFYRNGDTHYKGLQTAISKKLFPTFETLIMWLNEKIPTTCGVRSIFDSESGRKMLDINQFQMGGKYVVSSTNTMLGKDYGKADNTYWRNKALSAGKIRRAEVDLFFKKESERKKKSHSYPNSRVGSNNNNSLLSKYPAGQRPRVLTIRHNIHRDRVQKVILNPKTTQTFEEMMRDIGTMLEAKGEDKFEVTGLFTAVPPYKKISSFSALTATIGTLRTSEKRPEAVCSEFIACGKEKYPTEMLLKNNKHNRPPVRPPSDLYQDKYSKQPALLPSSDPEDSGSLPGGEIDILDRSPRFERHEDLDALQQNGSVVDDGLRQSRDDLRQSRDTMNGSDDLSRWTQNPNDTQSPPVPRRAPNNNKPYRKSAPQLDSIKVHIHGNLREFFVPRYGLDDSEGAKPDKDIDLNWVYGYRGRDAHNNLYTLISDEILYYVASIGVIYDKSRENQRHYREHTEDITCMAVLEDGASPRVATGQAASKDSTHAAHIRIWDPFSMTTLRVIGHDIFQNAVTSVAFSNHTGHYSKGSLLLAIDDSSKHNMFVIDQHKGVVIAKTPAVHFEFPNQRELKTSADSVVWGTFHPDDHTTIITFGKQHIYFWWLDWKGEHARILRDKQSGLMPINDLPLYVTSIAFAPPLTAAKHGGRPSVGHVITGDSNGCVLVWERDPNDAYVINQRCSEPMRHAHSKAVFALCMMQEGTLLSAAGGEIKAWDTTNKYRPVKTRDGVRDEIIEIPDGCGTVRTMVPRITSSTDGSLFIGTTNNCILEGSLQEKFSYVVYGHSDELWALDTHPNEQVFVSAGFDQYVTKWSMQTHKPLWRYYIEKPGLSVSFSIDGNLVVVGTTIGRFIVLNGLNGQHITSVQVASDLEALDGIKFSPDGSLLAMGCHDGNIYIYESMDDGKVYRKHPHNRAGILKGHEKAVTYLDWSNDSKYLQTVSEEYDLLCWDVSNMKETPAEMMREVEWASQTCVLNYNILGAWSNLKEGDDITSIDRNKDTDMIAVGDVKGNISLYRYPCTCERPEYHRHKVYSGKINKLIYSCDDRFLMSSGGTEAGLMQWVIV